MLYIFLAAVFYAIAIMLSTVASRNANSNFVTAIIHLVSSVIPIAIVLPILNKQLFVDSKLSIILAVLAGICITVFGLSLNRSYTTEKVAIVVPLVMGGSIFLTSILSYFFFKEQVTLIQGIGLIFLAIGLGLIIYAKATGN